MYNIRKSGQQLVSNRLGLSRSLASCVWGKNPTTEQIVQTCPSRVSIKTCSPGGKLGDAWSRTKSRSFLVDDFSVSCVQAGGLCSSSIAYATQRNPRNSYQPQSKHPVDGGVAVSRPSNEVGTIYVQCTKNNTICTLVDAKGMPVAWTSAGSLGYKNSKKKNVQVSQHVAEALAEKCLANGFRNVRVVMKGLGYGKQAAVRAISKSRLQMIELHEQTPVPHNGCRAPKRRRI